MAINNLNPRRTVWFSPHEPSNKYDIWLSKNAHYDENGEPTTDSNSQRDCDYIFKIYDCGKWNPIVGFNSTAANKIDVVEGNNLYHPAIFTGENPNDLYDAGTLGEILANSNFVTQNNWVNLFNTTHFINAFNNVIINGDEYNWENLIQNIISGGNVEIPFATTNTCGGIYADTFGVMTNAFKPVEVKFYPLSSLLNHRLCVNAGDIITQINEWQNDNPTQPGININIEQIINQIINSFSDEYPLFIGGNGIVIGQTLNHAQITWGINGLQNADAGKFAVSKIVHDSITDNDEHWVDWVDINIEDIQDIEIDNPTLGQSLVYDGSKWVNGDTSSTDTWRPIQVNDNPIASDYTFDIHSGIGITFSTTQSNREAVCKIEQNVQYVNESEAPILTGDLLVQAISINTSYPHGGCQIEGTYQGTTGNYYLTGPYICRTILYNVTSTTKINFNVMQTPSLFDGNPVYYKLKITGDPSNVSITFVEGSEYIICDEAVVSDHLNAKYNNYLITIQFGIVKIEPIMIQSGT